ncbi:MAG: stage III sporulation protein AA [Firmicutes bacterium]|nr:stage III sporulation protein AA [Bacillota bacterium]MDH7495063.1 stage III sporulation protein AA [Bacillota bacterium]
MDDVIIDEIAPCLPARLRSALLTLPTELLARTHEIRLRRGRPVMLIAGRDEAFLASQGGVARGPEECYILSDQEAVAALQLMAGASVYAFDDELRQGYITLRGGHRVGIVGRAVVQDGAVKIIKDISGFCIRVSHEVLGAADAVMPHLVKSRDRLFHTLIVSPPRCGKTTLLRDIARQASDGAPSLGLSGLRVGIVDERSEIAACFAGLPQNTVGLRTDVLDACPKAAGMIMLVRSMSPDLVATDEIGREEDAVAVREVMNAGVSVVVTAHGESHEDVARRPALRCLFEAQMFERVVILSSAEGPGTVETILDLRTGKALFTRPARQGSTANEGEGTL